MRGTQLIRSAYRIGRQDGIRDLASALRRYFRKNLALSYWKGQFQEQLVVECGDTSVTFDTNTRVAKNWFYPRYLNGQLHEPAFTHRLLESLNQDSILYDIGANVGYFTIFASEVCTRGEVHSFELDEKFTETIKASLDINGTSAEIIQKAVSDEPGRTVSFTDSTVPNITGGGESENSAETTTLDDYQKSNPAPNVLKVDVEGFEYNVLQGAQRVLSHPDVEILFLEIHPDKLEQFGFSKYDVFSSLENLGYSVKKFNDHRKKEVNSEVLRDVAPDEVDDNMMLECRPEL